MDYEKELLLGDKDNFSGGVFPRAVLIVRKLFLKMMKSHRAGGVVLKKNGESSFTVMGITADKGRIYGSLNISDGTCSVSFSLNQKAVSSIVNKEKDVTDLFENFAKEVSI